MEGQTKSYRRKRRQRRGQVVGLGLDVSMRVKSFVCFVSFCKRITPSLRPLRSSVRDLGSTKTDEILQKETKATKGQVVGLGAGC
jgi:hypothetical protein